MLAVLFTASYVVRSVYYFGFVDMLLILKADVAVWTVRMSHLDEEGVFAHSGRE